MCSLGSVSLIVCSKHPVSDRGSEACEAACWAGTVNLEPGKLALS